MMNLDDYLVSGTYYRIRFLEPEQMSEGGIALPENTLPESQSGVVLGHGPGRLLDSGARYPMQCGVGDVVVARACDFDSLGDGEAFVADERLVAIRRWGGNPEDYHYDAHMPLEAANDWVLVRPDAAKAVDPVTSATVARSSSPVLQVTASVGGAEMREIARARECIEEMEAIGRSNAYQEQPDQYYKDRMIHNYLDGLSQWEYEVVGEELRRGNKKNLKQMVPMRRMHRATAGTVLSVGEGRVQGWTVPDECTYAGRFQVDDMFWDIENPHIVGILRSGDRVHFDRKFKAVALFSEEGSVWALKCRDIAAVEVE